MDSKGLLKNLETFIDEPYLSVAQWVQLLSREDLDDLCIALKGFVDAVKWKVEEKP